MVRIVSKESHPSVLKEVICNNCGVTLEYVPADIKKETHRDYGGGSDTFFWIDCPNCNQRIAIRRL